MNGLERHEYGAALKAPLALDYRDLFAARAPINAGTADAGIGGWHRIWPKDDFHLPLELRLALRPLRDAEP